MKFLVLLTMICIVSSCGNYLKITKKELNSSNSSVTPTLPSTGNNLGVVSFLAGNISSAISFDINGDGTKAGANFSDPYGTAIDSTNTYLYVTDSNYHTIRKIEIASGIVTTLAGTTEVSGSADGSGTSASFNYPTGIAIDSSGNLYVTDSSNFIIRKITSSGVVTTLAGTAGVSGSVDGSRTSASFNNLTGIAIDSMNTSLYVVDQGNYTIRKIEIASGIVTTLTGTAGIWGSADGTGTSASFSNPSGIAIDSTDTYLYVADSSNHTIRKIEIASGIVTTLAGTTGASGSADGSGTSASFNNPTGIAIDSSGNLYVADNGNQSIRKITSSGAVTTLAGSAGSPGSVDGTGTSARFMETQGIATDSSGNLYVSDSSKMGNSSIRKIVINTRVVTTLAGRGGNLVFANGTGAAALFNFPYSIATDNSGNLYVCDTYNFIIRKITSSGVVTTLAGTAGLPAWADGTGSAARFFLPVGIVIDPTNTYLYVVDVVGAIRKIAIASGVVTTLAGSMEHPDPGSVDGIGTSASFREPQAIAIDPTNTYLYVVDAAGIRKINISTKAVTTIPGVSATRGDQLALDLQGNIYVSSSSTNSISKIIPEGVQSIFVSNTEGLINPMGIKIDSDGNLFVADSGNNQIKKITSTGVVSTFVSLTASPAGIAIDSSGNLYITDMNSIIRKIE